MSERCAGDLDDLKGTIIAVSEDTAESEILLTYDTGKQLALTGQGYDGLWRDVIITIVKAA